MHWSMLKASLYPYTTTTVLDGKDLHMTHKCSSNQFLLDFQTTNVGVSFPNSATFYSWRFVSGDTFSELNFSIISRASKQQLPWKPFLYYLFILPCHTCDSEVEAPQGKWLAAVPSCHLVGDGCRLDKTRSVRHGSTPQTAKTDTSRELTAIICVVYFSNTDTVEFFEFLDI